MSGPTSALQQAARALAEALGEGGLMAVSTGAGMSRESGIPTFRGAEGVWRTYRAEDVATPQALLADPALAWQFHDHLRQLVTAAEPHAGHRALAQLAHSVPPTVRVRIITQNVDRLHEKAGSCEIIHLHGDIRRVVCTACDFWDDAYPVPVPACPPICACGGLLRPDVVLFGEPLPSAALEEAWGLAQECSVMIVVGTSVNVQPAASLPFVALEAGAVVVEVNPDETPLSRYAHFTLRGGAATVLPSLVEALSHALRTH